LRIKTVSLLLLFLLLCVSCLYASDITVVYPKPDQIVRATDSTFIFGHIPDNLLSQAEKLIITVNGLSFEVHEKGGFLAFVPVEPGEFDFDLQAYHREDLITSLASGCVSVSVPEPLAPLAYDSLQIIGDYKPPAGVAAGDLHRATGDQG